MISILHISDFHYNPKKRPAAEERVKKLKEALQGRKIDLIVFTGDLVNQGADAYDEAAKVILYPLAEYLGLQNDHVIIVPGNHDLDRKNELPMVQDSLKEKSSVKEVETFCDNEEQLDASLRRFEKFTSFTQSFYKGFEASVSVGKLCTTFSLNISGKDFGVVGLNSAWRCMESKQDKGNLIFPLSVVENALSKFNDNTFLMCATHHDFSYFKEDIYIALERIIYNKCHFAFSGHNHRPSTSAHINSSIGLISSISPAVSNRSDDWSRFGFCVWDINDVTYEADEQIFMWDVDSNSFNPLAKRCLVIPMAEAKKEQNKFRELLHVRLQDAKERADKEFVTGSQSAKGLTFQQLFKKPIIKDKSLEELIALKHKGTKVSLESIAKDNDSICLVGGNKCGKTAILRKIQIDMLGEAQVAKVVPYFVMYKDLCRLAEINFEKDLTNYLQKNKRNLESFLEDNTILILLDDFDYRDVEFTDKFQAAVDKLPKVRVIATCESVLTKPQISMKVKNNPFKLLYIHDITENEVHEITLSWPNLSLDMKYKAEEKILKMFKQMNMPFNYWTVSLFLWIFEKTSEHNVHNNFELVTLYIDDILDRRGLWTNNTIKLDYDDLKSYLADLAYTLYKRENGYTMTMDELTTYTIDYRKSHMKFNIDAVTLLGLLRTQQIIEEIDGRVAFRLNGVFEFFLAYKMQEDDTFKDEVLDDREKFLSFGNELEYYAGFKRKDIASIRRIFGTIKEILYNFTQQPDFENVDSRLNKSFNIDTIKSASTKLLGVLSSMSEEQIDDIGQGSNELIPIDTNSSVRVKQSINLEDAVDTHRIERALFILGRVFRNSNVCDEPNLGNDILNYLLTGVCNFGFQYTETINEYIDCGEDLKKLIQKVTHIVPILVSAFLYDAISQNNLEQVFKNKLSELYEHKEGNEYRIFILTLLLTDMNYSDLSYWDDAQDKLKMNELRFAMYNKLILMRYRYNEDKRFVTEAFKRLEKMVPEFNPEPDKFLEGLRKDMKDLELKEEAKRKIRRMDYGSLK